MRGTGHVANFPELVGRITPACAGNSGASAVVWLCCTDHPRVCGEQGLIFFCSLANPGSPPRVRGTGLWTGSRLACARITPACAGNRLAVASFTLCCQDHPRVCGEQDVASLCKRHAVGSPPRVRGTAGLRRGAAPGIGITPACAGNRRSKRMEHSGNQDHPRVCGEQPRSLSDEAYERGSPPRVRGTAKPRLFLVLDARITPACAGNSAAVSASTCSWQDHPRVCGEQPMAGTRSRQKQGSPPRVRGTG